MLYLFIQTWIWILAAGVFGLFIGWLIWGRSVDHKSLSPERSGIASQARSHIFEGAKSTNRGDIAFTGSGLNEKTEDRYREPPSSATIFDDESKADERPQTLSSPQGEPDDLKRIRGIGPVIEKKLNDVGIYHFHQIAAFSDQNIRWIDNNLAFPGRVNREQWVSQAKLLEMGVGTEFSNRYDSK
jgi:predicted flap endonuclease-1-like 5' DNA nuclease